MCRKVKSKLKKKKLKENKRERSGKNDFMKWIKSWKMDETV